MTNVSGPWRCEKEGFAARSSDEDRAANPTTSSQALARRLGSRRCGVTCRWRWWGVGTKRTMNWQDRSFAARQRTLGERRGKLEIRKCRGVVVTPRPAKRSRSESRVGPPVSGSTVRSFEVRSECPCQQSNPCRMRFSRSRARPGCGGRHFQAPE